MPADSSEPALAEAAEPADPRFRARFEQSLLPQAMLSLRGHFLTVNQAFADLLGMRREDFCGRPSRDLYHAEDTGRDAAMHPVARGDGDAAGYERVLRHADGHPVPARVHLSLVRDAEGEPSGLAAFVVDTSGERAAALHAAAQDAFFRALTVRSNSVAVVFNRDHDVTYLSPSVQAVLGYRPEDLPVPGNLLHLVHPDEATDARSAVDRVLGGEASVSLLLRVRHADGSWRWTEGTLTNHLGDPTVEGVVVNLHDVTDRLTAVRALRTSERRFRTIAETAAEGIWALSESRTVFANAKAADILGVPLRDLYEAPPLQRVHRHDRPLLLQRLATRPERGAESYELRYHHPDGSLHTLRVNAAALDLGEDTAPGSIVMLTDVTEEHRIRDELARRLVHDPLTGLPNRVLLEDRLQQAAELVAATPGGRMSLLFVDLDEFKVINDSRGHNVGDQLLLAVAARLTSLARTADTVARFGGDEFVILCPLVGEPVASRLGEQVIAAFREPFTVEGRRVHLTASVGVASTPPHDPQALLRFADAALHAAKGAGRARVAVFDPEAAARTEARFELAMDLREAIVHDALELYFQPIVSLNDHRLLGVEALLRWQHPRRGAVPPDEVVRAAEHAGVSAELDEWVLTRACRDMVELRLDNVVNPDTYLSVNISGQNVNRSMLPAILDSALSASGLPASSLLLEITERTVVEDSTGTTELLGRLRSEGIRVAVDDFGTGYSSLAYLAKFPVSVLKIDRMFVAPITEDPDALAIVGSIIDLGRVLSVSVVAEGVEHREQADLLRRLGCDAAQGFLWSPAVPAPELARRLHRAPRSGVIARLAGDEPAAAASNARSATAEHGLTRMMSMHRLGASPATIASALNREGFRSPSGQRRHRASVERVLREVVEPTLQALGASRH